MAADELDIDPVEIRKQNFIPPEAFPLTTVTGANYDVGEYAKALDEACRDRRLRRAARRAAGRPRARRRPPARHRRLHLRRGHRRRAVRGVRRDRGATTTARVTATVGTSAHGQGHETAFAMIVQELLGIPMEQVTVVQSDTGLVPRGTGTMGSRSLQIGGSALYQRERGGAGEGPPARRAPARGERRRHRAHRRRSARRGRSPGERVVVGRARGRGEGPHASCRAGHGAGARARARLQPG